MRVRKDRNSSTILLLDIKNIQRILDNAEHGVIYISWGSMIRADTLPEQKRDAIVRAVGRFPQSVLWKWENETLPHKPKNLFTFKWLPQREILCHPKLKVFLTHGGLMGSTEAVYCGVAVVTTPLYGDQFLNAAALENRGMGVILNYDNINENTIFRTVQKALQPIYQENAKRVSNAFKHRPQRALETAVWWVEYVAKTEGALLTKSAAIYQSKFVYYSFDIYTFLSMLIALMACSWIILLKWLSSKLSSNKQKND